MKSCWIKKHKEIYTAMVVNVKKQWYTNTSMFRQVGFARSIFNKNLLFSGGFDNCS